MKRYPLAKRLVCAALFLGLALQVQAAEKRVKVFILAGQSNMEGHGLVRSLDWLGQHPQYGHLLKQLKNADGSWAGKSVWCDFRSPSAGEMTWDEKRILKRDNHLQPGLFYRKMVAEIKQRIKRGSRMDMAYSSWL